jgi:hypothetical protein
VRRKREAGGAAHLASASRYPEHQPAPHPGERETADELTAPGESVAYPDNGAKTLGTCPVCGKPKLDVTRKARGGHWVSCWSCEASGLVGREYLTALLDAIGAKPNQGGQLLHEGPAFEPLRAWLDGQRVARSARISLPSIGAARGWAAALGMEDGAHALTYLTEQRGISLRRLLRYSVGWDRDGGDLTFPTIAGGAVVNLYRRKPLDSAKMRAARGVQRQPYPDLPVRSWWLLVAGELDALTGRMYGLPAVTVSGKRLPKRWVPVFAKRPTAVMFDVGEEPQAERVVRLLLAAGGTAWVVRLALLGLPEDGDLNDYHRAGGSIADLRKLISSERRRAS